MTAPARAAAILLATATLGCAANIEPSRAQADTVAYLVNVTVRPGYNFATADAAIAYGRTVCARIDSGQRYADVITGIKSDFDNPDEYQASYLISQAVNELCPGLTWQLRNSAADYRPQAS